MATSTWNDYEDDTHKEHKRMKNWKNGLFSCGGEMDTLFYALLCPCFAAGEIYTNADIGSCAVGCMLYCFFRGACHPCCVTSAIREQKDIKGNIISDCVSCTCCSPCHLARELKEVRELKPQAGQSPSSSPR